MKHEVETEEHIILRYLNLPSLIKEVNVREQGGWERIGGITTKVKHYTVKAPAPSSGGKGLQSLATKDVPDGVRTIYLQAMFKRKK